jgi:hypothetical protein
MKKYSLFLLAIFSFGVLHGQNFAIAADKMNILYIGIDNPITISAENNSVNSLIVQTTNGKITGKNGKYIFRSNTIGPAEISLFKKTNKGLTKIGSSFFRVKNIPLPVFKIGPGTLSMPKPVLANQQFVRADLENFDFEAHFSIDSFTVCIIPNDTCTFKNIRNIGGKLNEEIRNEFLKLKERDVRNVIIFKDIFAKGPDGTSRELMPVMITVY